MNSITEIQNLYNYICEKHNTLRVKVQWMPEYHVDYTSSNGVYYSSTLPHIIYLKQPNEVTSISNEHTAYYNMSITPFEYVVYHELYHHISSKQDGKQFEKELELFIQENMRPLFDLKRDYEKHFFESLAKQPKELILEFDIETFDYSDRYGRMYVIKSYSHFDKFINVTKSMISKLCK